MSSFPRHGLRAVTTEPPPARLSGAHLSELLDGPTVQELAAIEAEEPVITAGLELLDVEIELLDRELTELDARRLRRARHRLIAAELAVYGAVTATAAPSLWSVA